MKYLRQRDWTPVVATTFGEQTSYPDNTLLKEAEACADIHRLGGSSSVWKTTKFFYQKVSELTEQYNFDWLVTTSPRDWDHLIGWWVSRLFDIPWQCDLRDPPGLSGYRRIKKWFINDADLITTAWPPEDLLPETLKNHGNAHWIPNGFDFDDFTERSDSSSKIKLVYTGSLYREAHDPFPFLRSLDDLKEDGVFDDESCEVLFMGNISGEKLKHDIHSFLEEKELVDLVQFQNFSDHSNAARVINQCDIALLMCFNRAIPYKFVEYIGAEKPITGFFDENSILKQFVEEEESIQLFERDNKDDFQQLLSDWLVDPPQASHSNKLRNQFDMKQIATTLNSLYTKQGND